MTIKDLPQETQDALRACMEDLIIKKFKDVHGKRKSSDIIFKDGFLEGAKWTIKFLKELGWLEKPQPPGIGQ